LHLSKLLVAALLGGCAAGPGDTTLEVTFDVCQPVAVVTRGEVSARESASIDRSIEMWLALGPYELKRDPSVGDQEIEVVFQDAADPFHGLYDDEYGVVYINRRLADDHQRAVTVAHELGHAFGLWHIDRSRRISVMNPANLIVEPNQGDAAELDEIWGPCGSQPPR
jgi:hypothetical protein